MNEEYNFEAFYEETLKPEIAALAPVGDDAVKWLVAGIASFLLGFAMIMIHENAATLLFLVLLVISVVKYTSKKDRFTDGFKETVIKEIIEFVNPGAVFNPDHVMSQEDYKRSGLYTRHYSSYEGQDMIKGMYKNVTYYCSEVSTYYTRGSSRLPEENFLFYGLLFAAPISSIYSGCTYVWPAGDAQLAHSMADEYFNRRMPLPEINRIETGNEDFNKKFLVYSNNLQDVQQLLTDAMMNRIMSFEKQIERAVRCSFINGICYVAIEMEQPLFQPDILTADHKNEMKEYFYSFLLILSIINQLNLWEIV